MQPVRSHTMNRAAYEPLAPKTEQTFRHNLISINLNGHYSVICANVRVMLS